MTERLFVSCVQKDDYGSTDETGFSPTECEFDEVTWCGKVRLIFVRGADDARRDPLALSRKAGSQTPALAAGLIERTVPENPTSRLQRHRLIEQDRAWLAARDQVRHR